MAKPLAERMRPTSLDTYVGQKHLIGENGVIRQFIKNKMMPSIILWGPPGVGKTTLAQIIAKSIDKPFFPLSAINSGVKDVREAITQAEKRTLFSGDTPLVFIDEIHRFSKSQQDSLLNAVEKGIITLIGATTENPSFEVIGPLLSRCQVYVLKELERTDLEGLMKHVLEHDEILSPKKLTLKETEELLAYSGGDARKLLNALEIVAGFLDEKAAITNEAVKNVIKENLLRYDKSGDHHYDTISAFIKSLRGSDPNAAVYWLARMIEAGEDPKFIARRLIIHASEDVGNANPTALVMAVNCFKAVEVIGMPESRLILSQCTIYIASSPKSNASYKAIGEAQNLVRKTGNIPVPLHLRNAPTQLMKELNYGGDYQYPHDAPQSFVMQEYFPESLEKSSLLQYGNNQKEQQFQNYMSHLWGDKYQW